MKVYIAAPWPLRDDAIAMKQRLTAAGFTVTSRWLEPGNEMTDACARKDLTDVAAADALLALGPPGWENVSTGGRHVELGYAIAHDKHIVLVGERVNVFHHHSSVVQVIDVDIERALRDLESKPMYRLTFDDLIAANLSRVERWHALADWSPLEWAGAMCGEAGEAANAAKKLKRIEGKIQNIDKRGLKSPVLNDQRAEYAKMIGMECADAIIYSVLLCARVDVDLVACIREAFNAKSEEYGFPERL